MPTLPKQYWLTSNPESGASMIVMNCWTKSATHWSCGPRGCAASPSQNPRLSNSRRRGRYDEETQDLSESHSRSRGLGSKCVQSTVGSLYGSDNAITPEGGGDF